MNVTNVCLSVQHKIVWALFFLSSVCFPVVNVPQFFTYLLNVKGLFKYSSSGFITVVCLRVLIFELMISQSYSSGVFPVRLMWRRTQLNDTITDRYLFCLLCSRVMTYREHGAWVVKAHLQKETDGHIISVRYALALSLMIYTTCFCPGCLLWFTDRLIPHQC